MITHWFRFFSAKLLLELFSALIVFGVAKLILMPFAVITLASVMNVYIVFTILNLVFAGCYARDGNRLAEIGRVLRQQ
jgi:hypothetical protein